MSDTQKSDIRASGKLDRKYPCRVRLPHGKRFQRDILELQLAPELDCYLQGSQYKANRLRSSLSASCDSPTRGTNPQNVKIPFAISLHKDLPQPGHKFYDFAVQLLEVGVHLNLVLNCKTEKLKSFMRIYRP